MGLPGQNPDSHPFSVDKGHSPSASDVARSRAGAPLCRGGASGPEFMSHVIGSLQETALQDLRHFQQNPQHQAAVGCSSLFHFIFEGATD